MKQKLTILFLLAAVLLGGCKKEEPELTPEEKEKQEMEAIIKTHKIISPIADKALLSDNPAEALKEVAEQFKNEPEIEVIEFEEGKLALKYKKGGWMFWYINPWSDDLNTVRSGNIPLTTKSKTITPLSSKSDYPKILVINQTANDENLRYVNDSIDLCVNSLLEKGFNITYKKADEFNLNFCKEGGLKNYDGVFISSHGFHVKKIDLTYFCTGEQVNLNDKEYEKFLESDEVNEGRISTVTLKEKRNQKDVEVKYFIISKNFFRDYYQNADFANSFFYLSVCDGLKNDGLAEEFIRKGAKKVVGYNEPTGCYIATQNHNIILSGLCQGDNYEKIYNLFPDDIGENCNREQKEAKNGAKRHTFMEHKRISILWGLIEWNKDMQIQTDLVSLPTNTDFRFHFLKLEIQNASISLTEGEDKNIAILSGSGEYSVTSSDEKIVTVSVNPKNLAIKALATGKSKIIVTDNQTKHTAELEIWVNPKTIPVTGVTVSPTSKTLTEGETFTLTATVTPTNASNKSVTWSSNNTAVATVDSATGKVTAIKEGQATITATTQDGGKKATCAVTVNKKTISVTAVTVSPTSKTLTEGESFILTANVTPTNASNKSVIWSSNNTAVATVDNATGKVIAIKEGQATITATTQDGGKKATCAVTVNKKTISVTDVTVSPTSKTLTEGESFILTATVTPTNASNKSVTWSSNNTAVATVDNATGKVIAIKEGQATITATTQDGGKKATCTITVNKKTVSVTSITVSPTSKTLTEGESFILTANVTPTNASNKSVIWSSSNTAVATVDNATGKVIAIKEGQATISATTQDGGKKATCFVTVKAKEMPPLKLAVQTISLKTGETGTVSITSGTGNYSVLSSNTSIALAGITGSTVSIKATGHGNTTVIVTDENSRQTATINVTVLPKLTLSGGSLLLKPDESGEINITSGSGSYTAQSNNSGIATASVSVSKITVKGVSPGITDIVVTDTKTQETATIRITVNNWIKLIANPRTLALKPNETATVTITSGNGNYSANSNKPNVATATVSGNTITVKGGTPGNTDIVITDTKSKETTTVSVTVTDYTYPDLKLSTESVTLKVGEVKTVKVLASSNNYSTGNSNPDIVKVQLQQQGEHIIYLTGLAPGKARVMVADSMTQQRKYIEVTVTGNTTPGSGEIGDVEGEKL